MNDLSIAYKLRYLLLDTLLAPLLGRSQRQAVPALAVRWRSGWAVDVVVALLHLAIAWAITHQYVRGSLLVWGDHPGQFMRFWYPLTQAMPQSGHWLWGVQSWNPTWYAGYPELQFYPPGTTLLGMFLYFITVAQFTPEQIYNLISAIAFCLPLFTCYAFLRVTMAPLGRIPSILAGSTAGLLAISLKPMWGGTDAVIIGLVGERLAFGFAPLVLLFGWRLVEKPNGTRLAMASIALAFLVLLHPFHAPALVVAITLYALARQDWRLNAAGSPMLFRLGKQGAWLVGWIVLAIGLVAWWMLPLLVRYKPYAAALVRATPDQVISWFGAGSIEWLWLAALMALLLLAQRDSRVEATVGVLALLIPLLIVGILFNDRVLVARFDITLFDPIRFIAEYYLALVLIVGCAVGAATSRFLWRMPWLALTCSLVLGITLPPYVSQAWTDLRARIQVTLPSTLDGLLEHPGFNGYWDALHQDPTTGRIFFAAHYLHLTGDDGVVTPTTINSMTPYFTGREIIGGTFSHWSPIARWLWVGDSRAGLLPAQVESGDNHQIFGKAWEEINEDELAANFHRLNVTTIVTGDSDQKARLLLDSSHHFSRYWQNDYFTIYHRVSQGDDWLEARGATAQVVERSARRWVINIQESASDAVLLLKMSEYPLWRAQLYGQPLPITANAYGLQEIALPAGGPYTLEVRYDEGLPEWAGLLLSLSSLLLVGWLFATLLVNKILGSSRSLSSASSTTKPSLPVVAAE